MQLEQHLQTVKMAEEKRKEKEVFLAYSQNKYKNTQQVAEGFNMLNQRADEVERIVAPRR
jgi:hypothetical protein